MKIKVLDEHEYVDHYLSQHLYSALKSTSFEENNIYELDELGLPLADVILYEEKAPVYCEAINTLMERDDLSDKDLARIVGVVPKVIEHVRTGIGWLTDSQLMLCSLAFNVEYTDLKSGKITPSLSREQLEDTLEKIQSEIADLKEEIEGLREDFPLQNRFKVKLIPSLTKFQIYDTKQRTFVTEDDMPLQFPDLIPAITKAAEMEFEKNEDDYHFVEREDSYELFHQGSTNKELIERYKQDIRNKAKDLHEEHKVPYEECFEEALRENREYIDALLDKDDGHSRTLLENKEYITALELAIYELSGQSTNQAMANFFPKRTFLGSINKESGEIKLSSDATYLGFEDFIKNKLFQFRAEIQPNVLENTSFAEQVDMVLNGTFPKYSALKVSDTPGMLLMVGCDQLPILYTQQHLRDAIKPESQSHSERHGLTVEQVKGVPGYLENPCMILDSLSRDDSIVVVSDVLDNKKRPIIATIKPNGDGSYGIEKVDSNFLTSVYGRNGFESYIKRTIEQDKVLFYNKNKTEKLFMFQGLQLPEAFNNLPFNVIIHPSNNIVNKTEETPMFQGKQLPEAINDVMEIVESANKIESMEELQTYDVVIMETLCRRVIVNVSDENRDNLASVVSVVKEAYYNDRFELFAQHLMQTEIYPSYAALLDEGIKLPAVPPKEYLIQMNNSAYNPDDVYKIGNGTNTVVVQVEELLQRIVPIQAMSLEKALQTAEQQYKNEEIVLDGKDHISTAFNVVEPKPKFKFGMAKNEKHSGVISILQVNDEHRLIRFDGFKRIKQHGKFDVKQECYDNVGEINFYRETNVSDEELLEKLFEMDNCEEINHLDYWQGHTLSISDVLIIKNTADESEKVYFCDYKGFVELDHFFDDDLETVKAERKEETKHKEASPTPTQAKGEVAGLNSEAHAKPENEDNSGQTSVPRF